MDNEEPEELTEKELRRLLVDKRWQEHKNRLEYFQRTGYLQYHPGVSNSLIQPENAGADYLRSRSGLDYLLFVVEALAVLTIAWMFLNGLFALLRINQAALAGFHQPTLAPTPLINAVVLPDGHTPPNAAGEARPNVGEIPAHLLPLVQSLANIPLPTPAIEQAVRIQVRAISVDAPVIQGDGWEQLKKGVAQHIGTPNPGQNGNIVLAGHNDIYGEVFRDLDELKLGDAIILFTSQRQYTYVVTGTRIVMPTQVEVMDPTPNPTLTLISCHPYLVDNHRIVVSAVLQNP